METRYVSTSEAARILGVSRQAVLKRIANGRVRARKAGRNYLIERRSLVSPTRDALLAEIVRRLVSVYDPDRIYLFGSRARRDGDLESDYDLLVVVPEDASVPARQGTVGYEALSGLGVSKDVLVWTTREFDRRAHLKASLPGTVLREGLLLYAA